MSLDQWLTKKAIKALVAFIKNPIRISGVDDEFDIIIGAVPKKEAKNDLGDKNILGNKKR
jgi:hypothetical protein